MTSSNLVYLIALPLFSSALLMLLGRKADKWGHIFATLISASTFVVGAMEFLAMRDRPEESRQQGAGPQIGNAAQAQR